MRKTVISLLVLGMAFLLASGCAAPVKQSSLGTFDPYPLQGGNYKAKVENFSVILDASSSMAEIDEELKKFDTAKEVVSRMNKTIPSLEMKGALRTFGHSPCLSLDATILQYGLTKYSDTGLATGLNKIGKSGGPSPLDSAIDATTDDFKASSGRNALIIVSDGKDMDNAPVSAAKKMKKEFGDKLCIYTIAIGSDPKGLQLMENIAQAGACGFSVKYSDIDSGREMADFVEKVFVERVVEAEAEVYVDSDGDGVYDRFDRCPNTPRGVEVDSVGCPLDTDGDGVYDYKDKCPGTPEGANVNHLGCWIIGAVLFDYDKSDIKEAAYIVLDEIVKVINRNPSLKVRVDGHTDSKGSQKYNLKLSNKRAGAVMNYLIQKGIDKERLSSEGFGFSKPIASNDTAEGRAQNRRVELTPIR